MNRFNRPLDGGTPRQIYTASATQLLRRAKPESLQNRGLRSSLRTNPVPTSRRGFTLVEMMISLGLIGMVVGLGTLVGDTARGAFVTTSSSTQVEARLKRALDRVAMEIELAAADTLNPTMTGVIDNFSDDVDMQQVIAIVGGAAVLGNIVTIAYENDPGDAVDGVDNDGDGLVDEGQVTLTRDVGEADEQSVTICKNVRRFLEGEEAAGGDDNGNGLSEEAGFLILRDGDLLTIQITLEEPGVSGQLITRTSTTSVLLRN